MPHLVATLIYLSQNYSYYIRGDRSPLNVYCLDYKCGQGYVMISYTVMSIPAWPNTVCLHKTE